MTQNIDVVETDFNRERVRKLMEVCFPPEWEWNAKIIANEISFFLW